MIRSGFSGPAAVLAGAACALPAPAAVASGSSHPGFLPPRRVRFEADNGQAWLSGRPASLPGPGVGYADTSMVAGIGRVGRFGGITGTGSANLGADSDTPHLPLPADPRAIHGQEAARLPQREGIARVPCPAMLAISAAAFRPALP